MTKEDILEAIRTLAAAHGRAPGVGMMQSEAGIQPSDWSGKYWARWSDALREAGFGPNRWKTRYDENFLLRRYAELMRALGRAPTTPEYQLYRRQDRTLPNAKAYYDHFGGKAAVIAKVRVYCQARPALRDVAALCDAAVETMPEAADDPTPADADGYVYLLRSGRFYKIGRTNCMARRARELALQLPHQALRVHAIKTDDPAGVENYWHRRFADKRKNGEFFALNAADVHAFKRWRRI